MISFLLLGQMALSAIAAGAAVAFSRHGWLNHRWVKAAVAVVLILFVVREVVCVLNATQVIGLTSELLDIKSEFIGWDYEAFFKSGVDVRAGRNPYANDRAALNPPTALPIFTAFSFLPMPVGKGILMVLSAAASLGLVSLSQRALIAQSGGLRDERLPAHVALVLTAIVALSHASLWGIDAGQMTLFTAVCLVAALDCQGRGRPVWAGVFLTFATVKAGTMLPFLLLFLRRTDIKTWVTLAVGSLALCLTVVPPGELVSWTAENLRAIQRLSAPGMINDYTFESPFSEDLIGLDYAFYCLGCRDRSLIRLLQLAVLGALGAWAAFQVVIRRGQSRGAACSLVALYSMLFLYHRVYDTVILVVPLVYLAGRAVTGRQGLRWLASACVVALVLVMTLPTSFMSVMTARAQAWRHGWLISALILPYAVWLILAVMFGVWTVSRREQVV